MKKRILLLSGTHEGPLLARALVAVGFAVRATVTRAEACENLFGALRDSVQVEARGFTVETLGDFLAHGHADLVLDATHPFAVRITRIAQEVCQRLGVPLVRYERPDWTPPDGTHLVDSFAEAANLLPSLGTRILFAIGAKQLKHFTHLHRQLQLWARVLPSPLSVQQARDAGFAPEHILAMRPPFSRDFNRAIFQDHQIEVIVTKASGREGGVVEKVEAARNLGIAVVMIRRPEGADPNAVSSIEAAVRACQAHLANIVPERKP